MTSFDRREFLSALAALGLAATTGRARSQAAARFASNPFTLGVASGYPRPDGVSLWTRLASAPGEADGGLPPQPIGVRWEVARDEAMRTLVASGDTLADPQWAHSVHVDVGGLEPDRVYWYRFRSGDAVSAVGRTRTAPRADAPAGKLRFVFASCQHYEQGYFTAYRHIVRDDPHLVAFLGDYIYEASFGAQRVRSHGAPKCETLADYRRRYALYKRDPDLQAAHAACPWIFTWDDHEVENDYAGDQSFTRVPRERALARRAAAYKAYYEHQPLPASMRPQGPDAHIYGTLGWGQLATFHVMDTRQYRTPQPCQRWNRGGGNYLVDCAERTDEAATMLGRAQEEWLAGSLARSQARWNVLAQECLVAQLDLSAGPAQSFWTDAWDGYPASRRRVLESVRNSRASNPVFIGGDAHMFWASELRIDPDALGSASVATEFVGTSITSRSLVQPWLMPALMAENPHMLYGESTQRGYARVELEPGRMTTHLCAVSSVLTPESDCSTLASFVVEDGRRTAVRV